MCHTPSPREAHLGYRLVLAFPPLLLAGCLLPLGRHLLLHEVWLAAMIGPSPAKHQGAQAARPSGLGVTYMAALCAACRQAQQQGAEGRQGRPGNPH